MEGGCGNTCCKIDCFVSPLRELVETPDATIVIVLLRVLEIAFTFLMLRNPSASAKRRVAESGAAGMANAPLRETRRLV